MLELFENENQIMETHKNQAGLPAYKTMNQSLNKLDILWLLNWPIQNGGSNWLIDIPCLTLNFSIGLQQCGKAKRCCIFEVRVAMGIVMETVEMVGFQSISDK